MRKLFLIILLTTAINILFAQQNEWRLGANTGISFFTGNGAKENSSINYDSYTNSPLGKHPAPSYGIGGDFKHLYRNNFILGGGLGYENLRTKVNLTRNFPLSGKIGKTLMNNHSIYIDPYIGYRFPLNKFSLDVIGGFDFAYMFKCIEKAEYKNENGETKKLTNDRNYIYLDCRLRLQTNFNYKRISLNISYSYGLRNYYFGFDGGKTPHSNINALRVGLQYRIL